MRKRERERGRGREREREREDWGWSTESKALLAKKFTARRWNTRAVNIFPGRRPARIISPLFMFPTRVCKPSRSSCIPLAFCGYSCNDFFHQSATSAPRFHSIFNLTSPRNEIFYTRSVRSVTSVLHCDWIHYFGFTVPLVSLFARAEVTVQSQEKGKKREKEKKEKKENPGISAFSPLNSDHVRDISTCKTSIFWEASGLFQLTATFWLAPLGQLPSFNLRYQTVCTF